LINRYFIKRIIKILFISITLFVFYSCASPAEGGIDFKSYYTINYLIKAKQFLIFLLYLMDSQKKYWENIYSRLYYFYFTLARIKSILQKNKILENDHKEIWNLSKKEPRKIFGIDFKKIRADSDYEIIVNENIFIKESNDKILREHKSALVILINDIKDYCKRSFCDKDIKVVEEMLEEIFIKYEQIIDKINEYENIN